MKKNKPRTNNIIVKRNSTDRGKLISIIVTCYNEEKSIEEMYKRVNRVFAGLSGFSHELIFVDNASTDKSRDVLIQLGKKDKRVKAIFMSRNFGSPQPSFLAGMAHAKGNAVVLLHGDIQDPPELIPEFISHWERGYDVVYGVRTTRKGYGWIMNFLYKSFYAIIEKLSYIKIPPNAGEFSLIDRKVVKELLSMDEYDYYLRFLRAYVGFKQIGIQYVRDQRKHGSSTESILSGFMWAKTFIVNFSFQPLEWISKIALAVTSISFLLIIINLIVYFIYTDSPRGIPTVVILILFLGGIQLLSLSVIAEYLAKIFLEVKKRPKYIIESTVNLKR